MFNDFKSEPTTDSPIVGTVDKTLTSTFGHFEAVIQVFKQYLGRVGTRGSQAETTNLKWRFPPVIYIIYRLVLAIYADFWLIYTASKSRFSKRKLTGWPYALTNWTYFMVSLYLTMHAFVVIIRYIISSNKICKREPLDKHLKIFDEIENSHNKRSEEYEIVRGTDETDSETYRHLPFHFKIIWVLYNIASVGAFLVTSVYYAILWPNRDDKGPAQLDDIQVHGINSVLIIIEHCISAVPIRLLHVIYTILYGLVYAIFSVVLWVVDTNHVSYPEVLDWNDPEQTILVLVILSVIVLPLIQFIFFGIYQIKIQILKHISLKNSS